MNATRIFAYCTLMLFSTLGGVSSFAAEIYPGQFAQYGGETGGYAVIDDTAGYAVSDPFGPILRLDGEFGDGLGFLDSSYGIQAFVPKHLVPGESLFFVAFNGSVTDTGRGIANFGAGYRRYVPGLDRVFTGSLWYDVEDARGGTYQRVGGSVESLGKYLDFRANSYHIISDEFNTVSDALVGDPFFLGNLIIMQRHLVSESAYSGFDVETGGPVPYLGRHGLNGYVGLYHLESDHDRDATGVTVRAEVLVTDDLTVSAHYSEDDTFGANAWLSVVLSLPDGRASRWFKPRPVRERLAAPIVRSNRIHTRLNIQTQDVPLINPIDGMAFTVVHINPNATAPGDGTFENPLNNLENFTNDPDVDIIRVQPRNDDTSTNLVRSSTLELFDNQRLLSTHLSHTYDSTRGTFTLPGFMPTASGFGPLIMNSDTTPSAVVLVRANNEISGFRIDGGGIHDGIVSDTTQDIIGFNFNNNEIFNGRNGVVLVNATGTVAEGRPGLFNDNIVRDNTGDGFTITNSKAGELDLSVVRNLITNNGPLAAMAPGPDPPTIGGVGIGITTAGVINLNDPLADPPLGILDNVVTGNGAGLVMTAVLGGRIEATVERNIFDNNTDFNTGFKAVADGGDVVLPTILDNSFSENVSNGVELIALNGGTLAVGQFLNNLVVDNGANGIFASVDGDKSSLSMNIGELPAEGEPLVPSNIIIGNGIGMFGGTAGVHVESSNFGTATVSVVNNVLDNNLETGVLVTNGENPIGITDTGAVQIDVIGNSILRTEVGAASSVVFNTLGTDVVATISGNNLSGLIGLIPDPNNPGMMIPANPDLAFAISATFEDGTYDLTIGGTDVLDGNLIDQSAGAGIAVNILGSAVGSLNILNNTITRTVAQIIDPNNPPLPTDPLPFDPFIGDGIHVRLEGSDVVAPATAILRNSLVDANIIGDLLNSTLANEGRGIAFFLSEETRIQDLSITNNTIANNGDDGIQFTRVENGVVNNVIIGSNLIDLNGDDGIEILAQNTNLDFLDFEIRENQITNQTSDGIDLRTEADAVLVTNLIDNFIDSNGGDGIRLTDRQNFPTDLENQGGTWTGNTVTNNGGHGVLISSVTGIDVPLIIGVNGVDPVDGTSLGNLIEANGLDGIEINSAGDVQINNNTIARNGLAAVADQGSGIDINSILIGSRTATLTNNVITENPGDGIEIRNAGASVEVTAFGNTIDQNGGRGVDILNQPAAGFSPLSIVRFDNNIIRANGLEGFYVVNTSSVTQSQDSTANGANVQAIDPLLANGTIFRSPFLELHVNDNQINRNGVLSAFSSTGLVLRVGSSNGGSSNFTFDGGFASDGFGGVIAEVVNNQFGGNFGDDVFIESFTSTVDPATTTGVWNAMTFNPTLYRSDPLARLDLVFRGNTGDSLNVTRGESSIGGSGLGTAGAFYDNAEAQFKSRTANQNPGGPFGNNDADRRRNAQRLAARSFDVIDPIVSPDLGAFLYPGVGQSTFRIESDFDDIGFVAGDTFILDFVPVPPTTNADGVNFIPAIVFGELPFGWGTVAPGTFFP